MSPELDALHDCLLRAGIRPGFAARYVAELSDHLEDLLKTETVEAAWRRLGSPENLVAAIQAQPGVRSWTAQAPWATLTLGPLLVLLLGYVLPTLILFLGVRLFAADLDDGRALASGTWSYTVLQVLSRFDEHVMPVLAGGLAVLASVRQRAGGGWLLLGVVLTAFLGGGLFMMIDVQAGHPGHFYWGLGLKFAPLFSTVFGRSLESGVFNLVAILGLYAALRMRVTGRF